MALVDLHSAAASGDLARLRQRWWLNKYRINGYNRDKQTPLHLACINGHADVVRFLVNKKCKLNPCDNLNKTPLVKAVEHQHRDCAAILLEHGANHNHRSVNSNTALHFAVMVCNKSLVELLLEHGADIDAKNKLGYTPLTLAITTRCEEMVKFLLQKGADVNAQDNVYRTPLTVAAVSGNMKAIQLLLHHGAVFPESHKELYPFQGFIKRVQNDVIANEQIGSSCYETTPVIPLEPALEESCDVSTEGAAEKKDSGPAADQKKVSVHSIAAQLRRDILPAAGEVEKEADDSSWDSEQPNSEVLDEGEATVQLPADVCRMFPGPSVAKECSKGAWQAAGTAKEENNGSFCNPKRLSDRIEKVINPVRRPAGKRRGAGVCSVAEECGKGVLQPGGGGGAVKKEDTDSSWDSEPGPKCQGKMWAGDWLSAANCNRLDARCAAVERGKGILPAAAAGEVEKEADDSSWDSEPFSEIIEEVFAGEKHRAADHKGVVACSAAVEQREGVLQPEGGAGEDDDSSWDSETDSEGLRKVLADVHLPAADQNRVGVSSAAVEHGKAARAEQKEHFISSSENKLPTLQGKNLQLKVDSSTQTDSKQDEQPLTRQKLDKTLKKNSLERASAGTVKTNHRKEQKLLLEKLERCKTRLKDLKEPLNKNDYYAKSGKNALKESKVIKILRNMQGRLAESLDSSATAILQLEEHFQWLDMKMARLEDTIQQQAKTIEFFETIQ